MQKRIPEKPIFPYSGTLALVGSGEYLAEMNPVDEYLLGTLQTPPKVICLPTAAGTEGDAVVNRWMKNGIEHFQSLGADATALPVANRDDANNPAFAQQIQEANFVYLSGGKPAYLYSALEKTPVWDAVISVLKSGGVVAGCSAGAMIWGGYLLGFPSPTVDNPGFGLLPKAVIVPHFDEIPGPLMKLLYPLARKNLFVGIEGFTALILSANKPQVLGHGKVVAWERKRRAEFTQVDTLMWEDILGKTL